LDLVLHTLSQFGEGKGANNLIVLIPYSQIGYLAGPVIPQTEAQSGCRIQISTSTHSSSTHVGVDPITGQQVSTEIGDQEITIYGTPQVITSAARILLSFIFRQPLPAPSVSSYYAGLGDTSGGFWPQAQVPTGVRVGELEVKFGLRPDEVSRIIGKAGSQIRSICKQAHVSCIFEKQVNSTLGSITQSPCQLGNIRGDASNIGKAFEMMIGLVSTPLPPSQQPSSSQKVSVGPSLDPTSSVSLDGQVLGADGKSLGIRVVLMIPSTTIGFLLGTKGATIRETKEKSGANVTISGRSGVLADYLTGVQLQPVLVEGEAEQVLEALRLIMKQLEMARITQRGGTAGSSAGRFAYDPSLQLPGVLPEEVPTYQ